MLCGLAKIAIGAIYGAITGKLLMGNIIEGSLQDMLLVELRREVNKKDNATVTEGKNREKK